MLKTLKLRGDSFLQYSESLIKFWLKSVLGLVFVFLMLSLIACGTPSVKPIVITPPANLLLEHTPPTLPAEVTNGDLAKYVVELLEVISTANQDKRSLQEFFKAWEGEK